MRLSSACLLLFLVTPACSGGDDPTAPSTGVTPPVEGTTTEPPPEATLAAPDPSLSRIAARHILIAYVGALGADYKVTRSQPQARALAQQLQQELTRGGDFDALARKNSDDATAPLGGNLGTFERGVMQADFERVAFALAENQLSGVVETPFGYHIIQRLPLSEIHVAHVLVQWAGLPQSRAARSKDEARARAEEALAKLQGGTGIDDVAREFSDGPMAERGGDLGWFQRGQMVPAFDDAAFALAPGQTSGIVESPLGFHIIQRLE